MGFTGRGWWLFLIPSLWDESLLGFQMRIIGIVTLLVQLTECKGWAWGLERLCPPPQFEIVWHSCGFLEKNPTLQHLQKIELTIVNSIYQEKSQKALLALYGKCSWVIYTIPFNFPSKVKILLKYISTNSSFASRKTTLQLPLGQRPTFTAFPLTSVSNPQQIYCYLINKFVADISGHSLEWGQKTTPIPFYF